MAKKLLSQVVKEQEEKIAALTKELNRKNPKFGEPFGPDNPLLNLSQAADLCSMTRTTLATWVAKGFVPARRGPANTTLIVRSDLYASMPYRMVTHPPEEDT